MCHGGLAQLLGLRKQLGGACFPEVEYIPLHQNEVRSFSCISRAKQIWMGCSASGLSGIWAAEFPRTECLLGLGFSGICGAGFPKTE